MGENDLWEGMGDGAKRVAAQNRAGMKPVVTLRVPGYVRPVNQAEIKLKAEKAWQKVADGNVADNVEKTGMVGSGLDALLNADERVRDAQAKLDAVKSE